MGTWNSVLSLGCYGDKQSIKKNNIKKSSIVSIEKYLIHIKPSYFRVYQFVHMTIFLNVLHDQIIRKINTNRKAESDDDNYYSCEEI